MQTVIVYDKGDCTIAYDTAYRDKDIVTAIENCVRAHGRESNVRAIESPPYPVA